MVAISLYRGNLHKVSNVARQWLMPDRRISLKDFKILLRRRHRALSRIATTNHNPKHKPSFDDCGKIEDKDGIFEEFGEIGDEGRELEGVELEEYGIFEGVRKNGFEGKDGFFEGKGLEVVKLGEEGKDGIFEGFGKNGFEGRGLEVVKLGFGKDGFEGKGLEVVKLVEEEEGDGKDEIENGGGVEKLVETTESLVVEVKCGSVEVNAGGLEIKAGDLDGDDVGRTYQQVEMKVERVDDANPSLEIARKEEDVNDKQKRRQEIEEKLKMLKEKKHSLVQALKQILNVEEELKRRSYIQGISGQPPVGGGHVEDTHDSGSMSRLNTHRMGSEGYVNGRRTFDATLPPRTNSGVANSPSRFSLAGHQGLPPHLPSVSVSGTNYIASSPSPAASGGTSAFRDVRGGPSPWN